LAEHNNLRDLLTLTHVVQERLDSIGVLDTAGLSRLALKPGGLRLGTPAMTSRGFQPEDFTRVADIVDRADPVLDFLAEHNNLRDLLTLTHVVQERLDSIGVLDPWADDQ
jgi:hypothetical protein